MVLPAQSKRQLLVFGGDADPNITALLAAVDRCGASALRLVVGATSHPALTWDVGAGSLALNGEPLQCCAAFVRYDVFTALRDGKASSQYRALAWHTAVTGWLAAHPEVFIFNRRNLNQVTNKPLVLRLAKDCGLDIPRSVVTNDFRFLPSFLPEEEKIVKPINGGGYCQPLAEVMMHTPVNEGHASAPAIIQQRLVPPEVRIYAVGKQFFGFNVISNELDYRQTQDCRVEPLDELSGELTSALARLLEEMGLDFAAADFKTCPDTGRLLFLEVNNGPMFAAFDHACEGRLCEAMVKTLLGVRAYE